MQRANKNARAALAAVLAALGTAAVCEGLTLLATHDKSVRAASPWQDDPYDVMVSLAQFTVPMLGLVIALRLLVWRAPGGPDRAQQTARAAGVMTALAGLTAAFEWAALAGGRHRSAWDAWTWVLVGGLAVTSVLTVSTAVLLARARRPRGSARRWRHDWLGDAVLLGGRVPVLGRWLGPQAAAWTRERAWPVFVVLSLLASAVLTAGQAVGERWTDPLLIVWMLGVETASNLAFCVIGNALAGFVARPPRSRIRRVTELSVVTGCVAVQLAIAFRDALWSALVGGSLSSVPALTALTLGAGAAASLLCAALLLARRPAAPPSGGTAVA
ncbi:hypothetical protein [Streptomyces sp. NPDC020917]|uniref:hypothetical protein n=1 Tax=Streptomyces sp. NPDC020917 TaxID=3365102 RepID=UPI0037A84BDA